MRGSRSTLAGLARRCRVPAFRPPSTDPSVIYSFQGIVPVDLESGEDPIPSWGCGGDLDPDMTFHLDADRIFFPSPDKSGSGVRIGFESSWNPPSLWLEAAGAAFPGIAFDLVSSEPANGIFEHKHVHGSDRYCRDYHALINSDPSRVTASEIRRVLSASPDDHTCWVYFTLVPALWKDAALAAAALRQMEMEGLDQFSWSLFRVLAAMPPAAALRLLRKYLAHSPSSLEEALEVSDIEALMPVLASFPPHARRSLADELIVSGIDAFRDIARRLYVSTPTPPKARKLNA